jgi:hypothetical protein
MNSAEQFFYDHAGFSYDPNTQTMEEGHVETAKALAEAERKMLAGPYFADIGPEYGAVYDGDGGPYYGPIWTVTLYSVEDADNPDPIGSLGGVACDDGDPYLRVVAAELALEHIA